MTEQDIAALKELYVDLTAVCQHAQERGVKIIIDAEHSWYQVSPHSGRNSFVYSLQAACARCICSWPHVDVQSAIVFD